MDLLISIGVNVIVLICVRYNVILDFNFVWGVSKVFKGVTLIWESRYVGNIGEREGVWEF